jgi:hypothetical protein
MSDAVKRYCTDCPGVGRGVDAPQREREGLAHSRGPLDISAYGTTNCVARVFFKDGRYVDMDRYLDLVL